LGQKGVLQAEHNTCWKRDRNSENECCTKKQKRPPPTYQNPWSVSTDNLLSATHGFTYWKCGDV
jgi:hypothetical protein